MDVAAIAADLRREARRTNQRRVLVFAGARDVGVDAAVDALQAADVPDDETTVVTDREEFGVETVRPRRADELLGRTRTAVVCDLHDYAAPNVVGRVVGAVDGGGLLILLTPPLASWPDRRDEFDESLACPPFDVDEVTGTFRRRFVETLRAHYGAAVVDVDEERIVDDGLTGDSDRDTDAADLTDDTDTAAFDDDPRTTDPGDSSFPPATYEACLTGDQGRAVRALERLHSPGEAVVVEADRGRGKSSAAGLAAGAMAAAGADVLVTAPGFRNAAAVFARAGELLGDLDVVDGDDGDAAADTDPDRSDRAADAPRRLATDAGGSVRFVEPVEAGVLPGDPDAVVVDEAAALPVRLLASFLAAPSVAYCTTVHGYEGAGRSFDVRFRERLADSTLAVTDVTLEDPIRYARDDPVEAWAFRALLLDASPAVEPAVADATPGAAEYVALDPEDLLADENRLREAFGLLVLAHYRTEPNDLARLLDAPNLTVRALVAEGHVVSVALLAREGGLEADTRAAMYEGARVRGNMFPDVLTSQLRDEAAGVPVGYRVVRIATHHAVRSSGLGSLVLEEIADELAASDPLAAPGWGREATDGDREPAATEDAVDARGAGDPDHPVGVDYLGVGYGATPELLRFWADNGFRTVHLSTTRNDESGEYSALMGRPLTDAGDDLLSRHASWFRRRLPGLLADPLRDCDPDVVRLALATSLGPDESPPAPELSERAWRVLAASAWGGVSSAAAPDAARDLAVAGLFLADDVGELEKRSQRLLVRKLLQGHPWDAVADELGFVSTRTAMQALGEAIVPLLERWGGDAVGDERARHVDDGVTDGD